MIGVWRSSQTTTLVMVRVPSSVTKIMKCDDGSRHVPVANGVRDGYTPQPTDPTPDYTSSSRRSDEPQSPSNTNTIPNSS